MTSRFTSSTHLPAANLLRDYMEQHGRHALTSDLAGRRVRKVVTLLVGGAKKYRAFFLVLREYK